MVPAECTCDDRDVSGTIALSKISKVGKRHYEEKVLTWRLENHRSAIPGARRLQQNPDEIVPLLKEQFERLRPEGSEVSDFIGLTFTPRAARTDGRASERSEAPSVGRVLGSSYVSQRVPSATQTHLDELGSDRLRLLRRRIFIQRCYFYPANVPIKEAEIEAASSRPL